MSKSRKPSPNAEETWHRLEDLTIEKAAVAIFWVDTEGRFERVNSTACQMHGYSREELLARRVHDVTAEYQPAGWEELWRQLRTHQVVIKESHHIRRDGSRFPVEATICHMGTADKELCCCFLQDLTQRKAAEAKAVELARFPDENPFPVMRVSREGAVLYCNAAGRPALDAIGVWEDHIVQEDWLRSIRRVCQGAAPVEMEVKVENRVLLLNLVGIPDANYANIYGLDITARKQAETSLQQALKEVQELKDRLQAENVYLQDEIQTTHDVEGIVGESAAFERVLEQARQVAGAGSTVLILGETGTGKELLARAIHRASPRRDRPLVKVNCAALPSSLVESELFGHEKGAFTGALSKRIGRFELAEGGTLFLDEIGDLPRELQAKLLRVLQEGEFERVGGQTTLRADVRIIAATNRDLEEAVNQDEFREDLFYRLNVFPLQLPLLRERREDIPPLAHHFMRKHTKRTGSRVRNIPPSVLEKLRDYDWPGNVRELENVMERALILSRGRELELGPLGHGKRTTDSARAPTLKETEQTLIREALEACNWTIEGKRGAAARLDLAPSTLRERMRKYGLQRP